MSYQDYSHQQAKSPHPLQYPPHMMMPQQMPQQQMPQQQMSQQQMQQQQMQQPIPPQMHQMAMRPMMPMVPQMHQMAMGPMMPMDMAHPVMWSPQQLPQRAPMGQPQQQPLPPLAPQASSPPPQNAEDQKMAKKCRRLEREMRDLNTENIDIQNELLKGLSILERLTDENSMLVEHLVQLETIQPAPPTTYKPTKRDLELFELAHS